MVESELCVCVCTHTYTGMPDNTAVLLSLAVGVDRSTAVDVVSLERYQSCVGLCYIPVSYTHLDVYKRQDLIPGGRFV